jgi:hypothetical protein
MEKKMHLIKNEDGTFTVDDEPMRLEGEAAVKFLKQMENTELTEERRRFLEECDRVYQNTQEKVAK